MSHTVWKYLTCCPCINIGEDMRMEVITYCAQEYGELLLTCLNPGCVDPVCVHIELLSTCLNPVWCWSSACPHWAVFNLLHPASTQCGVDPVCFSIELLSTNLNLPQSLSWFQMPLFTSLYILYYQYASKVGLVTCLWILYPCSRMSVQLIIDQNYFIMRFWNNQT